ncbi:hypothetical protein D1AOALGA4SA_10099 [Olavius algarvensis Delta 1 endosymbiont]|nr:hypothetical protein D1AOALGA4SA_10099 [Olavius algarvensis Delta 1 endosymbiont]
MANLDQGSGPQKKNKTFAKVVEEGSLYFFGTKKYLDKYISILVYQLPFSMP